MAPGLHTQNKASQKTATESVASQLKSRPFASESDREQPTADSTAQMKGASRLSHNFSKVSVLPPTSVNGTQPIQLAYNRDLLKNELRGPNNPNGPLDFGFKKEDWHKKDTLEGQLASDARGMYGTMFGNPDNDHLQNDKELEQRKILNRAHVAMVYGNPKYRNNERNSPDKGWKDYNHLPVASLLAHGGRAQIHFNPEIQQNLGRHAGWDWMATGTSDANGQRGEYERQFNNSAAGLAKRTSTHNAKLGDGQNPNDKGPHEKSGLFQALTSKTSGMDLTTTGVGTPISETFGTKESIANFKNVDTNNGEPKIQHGGLYPIDRSKLSIKEKVMDMGKNKPGQQGHFLMAGRNLDNKNKTQKWSTMQLGIETSAPHFRAISGDKHDFRALSAEASVFGQNKFKNMIKPTDEGGLGLSKGDVPLGTDSLKSEITNVQDFQRIQKVSKYLEDLPVEKQRKRYQNILLSTPQEARMYLDRKYDKAHPEPVPNT